MTYDLSFEEGFAACIALGQRIDKLRRWAEEDGARSFWADDIASCERAYAKIAGHPFNGFDRPRITAISELLKEPGDAKA